MAKSEYSAEDIQVLEGLEAVRKRPGMYIGSTDARGLQHCMWEIIDNSVDEAIAGHCTEIRVILHADHSVEVFDNGRGIPVDTNAKAGLSGVELVFTKLHAGGKFGGGGYEVSGGLHGVGASVVNALSSRLDVSVDRDKCTYAMSFHRGEAGTFSEAGTFTAGSGLTKVSGAKPTGTGTRVRYWADREIFLADADIDLTLTHDRARQTAFLVPGLTLTVTDERDGDSVIESFHYDGGSRDFVEFLAPDPMIADPIVIKGAGNFTETVPVLRDGQLVSEDVERTLSVDVALRWGTGYDTTLKSFVNIIATPKGGTHVTGLERAVTKTMVEVAASTKSMKANEESPTKDDVLEGLTALICVRLAEPQFEGQTKEILGTAAATKIVADIVAAGLKEHLLARANRNDAKKISEKIVTAARTRRALRLQKETIRRKNALESSTLPSKLADCRSEDLERTEVMIVEGDSAMGTAKSARDSEFQALLPVRGKILNTMRATEKQMLDNNECASIITAIGAGSGKSFDISAIRYGKLIAMSVDGDESVLIEDRTGLRLVKIGPLVDDYLAQGIEVPDAATASLDAPNLAARTAPLKQVIRHRYQGTMRTLTTSHGRSLAVTAGHSVFTYENGQITLRPADSLQVGDLVVAPRRIPRPTTPAVELDLLQVLGDANLLTDVYLQAGGDPALAVGSSVAVPTTGLSSHERAALGRDFVLTLGTHRSTALPRFLAINEALCEALGRHVAPELTTPELPPAHNLLSDRLLRGHPLDERIRTALGLPSTAASHQLPSFVLNTDESCQLAFLTGWFHAAGSANPVGLSLTFRTPSRDLANGAAYVLGQLDVTPTLVAVPGSELSEEVTYELVVSGNASLRRLRRVWQDHAAASSILDELAVTTTHFDPTQSIPISETLMALPITHIADAEVDRDVYDFSVAGDESFVAGFGGGIMAHNTDADVDGAHIRCLLLTLCYRYMRPLLEEGRVYAAVPPLHRVTISGSGEHIYTYTDDEYQKTIADLEKAGKKIKGTQRYKGLGEMDADQLAETTLDPARRMLRRITMEDAEAASAMFEMLMGKEVAPRREYIVDNALNLSRDQIDA